MPILKPEIQKALRVAGLAKETVDSSLSDKLELRGLSLDSTLEVLFDLVHNSSNEVIKRQAVDTVLKLHGVLKEQAAPPPSITIVINDSKSEVTPEGLNPILIPRNTSDYPKNEKESIN